MVRGQVVVFGFFFVACLWRKILFEKINEDNDHALVDEDFEVIIQKLLGFL